MCPAEIKKRHNDQRVRTTVIHSATMYEHVAALMAEASISEYCACYQTMRNTYAAVLIDEGAPDAELSESLGLHLSLQAHRTGTAYRAQMPK